MKRIYEKYFPCTPIGTDHCTHLGVTLYYDISIKSFLYVANPVTIENKGTYKTISFIAYSGYKKVVRTVKRYSQGSADSTKMELQKHEYKTIYNHFKSKLDIPELAKLFEDDNTV